MNDDTRSSGSGQDPRGLPTLRLVFEVEGDQVRLISKRRVNMVAPTSDPVEVGKETAGTWFEVRDQKGRLLHRKLVANPLGRAVEVRSDDPQHPLVWQEAKGATGSFTVMVPAFEDAEELVLMGSRQALVEAKTAAEPIFRFSLVEDKEKGVE